MVTKKSTAIFGLTIAIYFLVFSCIGLINRTNDICKAINVIENRLEAVEEELLYTRIDIYRNYEKISLEIPERTPIELPSDCKYIFEIEEASKGHDFIDDLPALVYAIMQVESDFNPDAWSSTGDVGLMQINLYWQQDRIRNLNVKDIWDPYSNILVAVDLLEDLYFNYANEQIVLTVMMYNMNFVRARTMYYNGQWSSYAVKVFDIFNGLKGEPNA